MLRFFSGGGVEADRGQMTTVSIARMPAHGAIVSLMSCNLSSALPRDILTSQFWPY